MEVWKAGREGREGRAFLKFPTNFLKIKFKTPFHLPPIPHSKIKPNSEIKIIKIFIDPSPINKL